MNSHFNPVLRLIALVLAAIIALAAPASAQIIPLNSEGKARASGLEVLLDEARRDGSTVIVVQPAKKGAETKSKTLLGPKEFLRVRARVQKIFASAPSLFPNLGATLQAVDEDGSYFWMLKGLATALLGLLAGIFAVRLIAKKVEAYVQNQYLQDPQTTADKAKYLLLRALLAIIYSVVIFTVALLVALILDTGDAAIRRIFFEIALAYALYRFLRYGISWNLMAFDVPKYRLINLSDSEAIRMHRDWSVASFAIVAVTGLTRFFVMTGFNSGNGLFTGNGKLTLLNSQLLYISVAGFVILILIAFTIKNWASMRHIFAPADPTSWMYKWRVNLARLVPPAVIVYGVLAFLMFAYRVAVLKSGAGSVIAGPFAIGYVALGLFGLILIGLQVYYNRRIKRFGALAEAERARRAQEKSDLEASEEKLKDDEEMIVNGGGEDEEDIFEYRPLFRGLFESAALVIVFIFAVGELARIWGVPIGSEGNVWAASRDIILTAALCWFGYGAVRIYIDHKIEEEVGPEGEGEVELGGEGGGAGATRLATLLPIMRYVLLTIIFSITTVIILSKLDIDIGPIFAGAGVVGIAVGFGAQTLIRDMFSGAFFLMDDAFRKAEYVEIEGIKGVVEKISIRSFQLRHHLGALHTIPFGEIKQLTNYSRDWVMMKLPLRVTYDTDVEKVRKLVKNLGKDLLKHPAVGETFMQPLKSQGVYKMEDSAMIIRVKFMTKPGEQFVTRKVVYESIQDLFAREGIHFAHKEVTVRLADAHVDDMSLDEKQAVSSAARSIIDAEEEAAAAAKGGKPAGSGR